MRSHPPAACLLAMLTLSATAYAQTPPDVEDLVGARGAGGETQLLSRGYEQRDSNTVRDQRFTFWWNAKKNQCISVSTMEGRYASIQAVPAANCGASDASTPRASTSGERDPNSLVLVCYGAGTRPTVTGEPDYRWDDKRNKWHEADTVRATTEGFNSDVQIELYGDHGRIHLGAPLIPPINSHGDHGWWELDNLQVGPDRITASYRLNGMNKPRLTVDRRSGRINIEGAPRSPGSATSATMAAVNAASEPPGQTLGATWLPPTTEGPATRGPSFTVMPSPVPSLPARPLPRDRPLRQRAERLADLLR